MKHHIFKTAIIVSLVFATSCASTKYMTLDILQPAHISFSEDIVNVGIVDNAGRVIDDNESDVSIEAKDLITSKTKKILLESLTQFMNDEKYFNEVKLYPHALRTDKEYGRQLPATKSTLQQVAHEIDADALLVVETFETENREQLMSGSGWIFTAATANATMMFRLYNAAGDAMSTYMATKDSTTWIGDPNTTQNEMASYQQLALQLAETTTKNLIPYWETQERIFYTDGTKLMKEANKYAEKGKWADAAKVWGAAYEAQDKNNQKAKIAANIALANESLGDIPNAVEWIRIASNMLEGDKKSDEAIYINWYKIKLLEREQNNPVVMEQMGVEEAIVEE